MPNVGALLKQEMARIARKESRAEVRGAKRATAQHRRSIATLRRQVTNIERQVLLLQRRMPERSPAGKPPMGVKALRFVAKGLKSQRNRLGLSAADYAKLVRVSAQSVYNWEKG